MRHLRFPALAVGLVVAVYAPARADEADAKAARALVDKAIKAHGGAEALAKFPASTLKFKGSFHGMGMDLPMSGDIASFGPDKMKLDMTIEAGGQSIPIVNVIAGDKGWAKFADQIKELSADELAEAKEQGHAGWLAGLIPLIKADGLTLAAAGEQVVADKPALGVKVSAKGRRDVTLFFDKETGVLVKHEVNVKDEGSGQEVLEETFHSAHKDVQGTKQAAKIVSKRDGKLYLQIEVTEQAMAEKLDPNTFDKP